MSELLKTRLSLQLPQLSTRLSHLYLKQELTDLTIRCPNGSLMAHKLVLSLVSNYFRQQFTKTNKSSDCLVIFCDIPIEDIKTIVDIIYFGRQLIASNRSQRLLKIAQRLEINLISTEKNANKNRKSVNKQTNSDSSKAAHQNSLHINCFQLLSDGNDVQNGLIINEAENDISFAEQYIEEFPLDLRINEKGDNPLATNATIQTNSTKKRQRKQSDPKQNRKFIRFDESIFDTICENSIQEPVIETNESIVTALDEITGNLTNIPESNKSSDELSILTSTHLNVNETMANSLGFEENADPLVKSENGCCLDSCAKISIKDVEKESNEQITECCVCGHCFSNSKLLLNHLKKEHKSEKEVYECHLCSASFKWPKKFAKHSILCQIKSNPNQ